MPRKQIGQFAAAGSLAATDRIVLQQGTVGTPLTHGTLSQVLILPHPSLDVTGAATIGGALLTSGNVTVSGAITPSRNGTISAAGTSQATGTTLTAEVNVITAVSAGQGVVLPASDALILNRGTVDLKVYPPSGAQIEAYGTNTAVDITPSGSARFLRISSTLYRVL